MAERGSPEIELQPSTLSSSVEETATMSTSLTEEEAQQLCGCLDDIKLPDGLRAKLDALKSINIVIVGKYQVGKSTLINALFYKGNEYVQIAAAGRLEPTTSKVDSYPLIVGDITYNIYDTIGLQDGKDRDVEYIEEFKKKCRIAHLVIYCTKMEDPTRPDEIETLKNLTRQCGETFWQHAVIALTFANTVMPASHESRRNYFKELLEKRKDDLCQCFEKELHIRKKILHDLSRRILPVGSVRRLKLPGIKDWRADFWVECMYVCHPDAKGAVLKIGWKYPNFILKIATSTPTAATVGFAGIAGAVAGSGMIVGGAIASSTGILVPVGAPLIVAGVVSAALGFYAIGRKM